MTDDRSQTEDLGELTTEEIAAIRAARTRRRPPSRGSLAVPSARRRTAYRAAGIALGALLAVVLLVRLGQLVIDNPLAATLVVGIAVLVLRSHATSAARHAGRAWRWLRTRR
ncbi:MULTISPECIES: hypothetical protein [Catenuloplanes]|uniref:DUF3040 domain-containing protein n=1 Tax=Catenuloplanes niger TaxID=587534 RepID=A0AAE3ZT19_9ACTN|nr:hypothetical protein [Catenuloplanes niger]MDR7323355.1 hypothetical protein [Catenuloplanes niger]